MNWLLVITFIATIVEITSFIEKHVTQYFNSDILQRNTKLWQKHRVSYQNMLSVAMQESYGSKGLNVYIKRLLNSLYVSKGYYHTDNQVHIVLQNMILEDFPQISDPVISFPLLSNAFKLEAVVGKLIIHASYIQFRNTSRIVYNLRDQDSYSTSPFLFEQVKTVGRLAITVEGCKLSGIGITSLVGQSVNLGNTVFRLFHCQYNFEIFSPGVASPPVVANYLPSGEGLNIEHLIMKPLNTELRAKMQAALHTYVNTSAVFQESLQDIRIQQEVIFEETTNYVNSVVRNLNYLTINRNIGKILMEDFSIYWNDTFDEGPINSVITLQDMVLTGLETVYSSHTGGPFKLATLKISDELRFGTLQVRGSINLQIGDETKGMFDFAVEISDVEVDITFNIQSNDKTPPKTLQVIEVMGWRSFQFSCPGMTIAIGETLITGYLLAKVPIYLSNHLNNILGEAALETDKEYGSVGNTDDNKEKLGAEVPSNNDNEDNTNIDNGQDYNVPGEYENGDIQPNENEENQEKLAGDLEGEESDGMISNNDDSGIIQGVTSFAGSLSSAVTGPGGIVVDDQNTDAPGGIDYGELPVEDPGEVLELKPKFFDENMFNALKSHGGPDLRRKKLRMRLQKQRKWRKNIIKPIVRRATRTAKPGRNLTVNEIIINKK